MHTCPMRTSITLDDDVYELASVYARAREITLGAALGELVRRGRDAILAQSEFPDIKMAPNGLPVFRSRGKVLTSEMVKEAQEDDFE
jgi:hypothetical protein